MVSEELAPAGRSARCSWMVRRERQGLDLLVGLTIKLTFTVAFIYS